MGPEYFLVGKLFVLITGASRGIGRQLAIQFSQVAENDSQFLLMARNITGLRETANQMNHCVHVDYVSVDLSLAKADQLADIINKRVDPRKFDHIIIIHNAASTGNLSQLTDEVDDFNEWRSMYDLNVFSPAVLNSVIMDIFNETITAKKIVINLTSLAAKIPLPSGSYYCSAKTAREMYFKVFAKEFPDVNVLNYSPFLTDTDLLRATETIPILPEFPNFVKRERIAGRVLTTTQAAKRLIDIIRGQKYKSGDVVDYYDLL